jgi:hypothetical protein
MGFFNNMKNFKDKALENEKIQNIDELQVVFDAIDSQAEKEDEKNQKEREYYESLTPEQKVEYNRIKKRNKNLKRLGMYGLTAAGMVTGVGIPVMMAANVGSILADDSLTFDQEKHEEKLKKSNKKSKRRAAAKSKPKKQKPKPREYFTISYDNNGTPKVSTLVDNDPYFLQFRYEELIRD